MSGYLLAKVVVPLQRLEIHEHSAAGIGNVRGVHRLVAEQVPQEPRVDGAESALVLADGRLHLKHVLHEPLDLECAKVGADRQAALLLEVIRIVVALEKHLVHNAVRARVQPH